MRLTIGKKLMAMFLLIAILLGITSSISYYYLKRVDGVDSDLIKRRAVILSNAQNIQVEAAKQSGRLRGYLLTKDQSFLDQLGTSNDNVNRLVDETYPLVQRSEDQEQLKQLKELNQEFKQQYEKLLQMAHRNQSSQEILDTYNRVVLPLGRQLDPLADDIAKGQQQLMEEGRNQITKLTDEATVGIATISISAVILAILIGYFGSKMISKPIVAIAKASEEIALGNLKVEEIEVKNKDEIGILAKSFNRMKENLQTMVQQINYSSQHMASSSQELSASAEQSSQASEMISTTIQEVASRAERQAHSVTEGVQAINEMSSGVQQIASSTQTTTSLSAQTSEKALEGNKAIQLTIKQMDSIHHTMNQLAGAVTRMNEQSKQIEQIVDVIAEIANQTNLLALNAAIEAARAGEQGRGFSVVAEEVRKLAEQSSQSAAEITKLVGTITDHTHHVVESMDMGVKEVDEGIRVVHDVGRLFEEIRDNIHEVSSQMQGITAACQQIAVNTEQVVDSVEKLSEESKTVVAESQNVSAIVEEQLAAVEEVSSSASSLSTMAENLQNLVGQFRV
ncbi:methyl-accepting chemotaxis protein [Brevibacillus ginsengisoli]|uniref:methyl-accepting chemotaxis protein n=1 Tax=Brevibacillus ginsengisoli TaxID=363854 RepID=UPI003CFA3C00